MIRSPVSFLQENPEINNFLPNIPMGITSTLKEQPSRKELFEMKK
jgi:hypothetical protein